MTVDPLKDLASLVESREEYLNKISLECKMIDKALKSITKLFIPLDDTCSLYKDALSNRLMIKWVSGQTIPLVETKVFVRELFHNKLPDIMTEIKKLLNSGNER